MYSGYVITFHNTGFWSFDNDTATKATIFGVDNSSSSHSDNLKNNCLQFMVLQEALVHQRISLVLILVK